jgi:hypothetical protein
MSGQDSTDSPLDPAKIMAAHDNRRSGIQRGYVWCPVCYTRSIEPCLPYRLAAENAALRAAVAEWTEECDGWREQYALLRDQSTAEVAALRAAIGRAEALADAWDGSDSYWSTLDAGELRAALALPEGEQ